MMVPILNYVDRCIFTATSNGPTSFVVASAVQGFQTPAAAGAISGKLYGYAAQSADLTQWEYGYGTLTIAGPVTTLTRTVIAGTNGASPVPFSAPPNVLLSVLAESLPGPLSNLFDVTISNPTDGQALVYNGGAAKWENDQRLIGSSATISGNAGSTVLVQGGAGLGAGGGGSVNIYAGTGGASGGQGQVLITGGGNTLPLNTSTAGYVLVQGFHTGYGGSVISRGGYNSHIGGGCYFTGGTGGYTGGQLLFAGGNGSATSFYGGQCGIYGGICRGTQTSPVSRGGNLRMRGGYGLSSNANGGNAVFHGGGSAGSGHGGHLELYGGATYGTGTGGVALIGGGPAYGSDRGGNLTIYSGVTTTGGNTCFLKMYAATVGGSGKGGYATLTGGQGAATGAGGGLKIYGGLGGATSGNGGDVIIKPGTVTSGTIGHLILKNLPTSNAGLTSGMVWNNAGVLSII